MAESFEASERNWVHSLDLEKNISSIQAKKKRLRIEPSSAVLKILALFVISSPFFCAVNHKSFNEQEIN